MSEAPEKAAGTANIGIESAETHVGTKRRDASGYVWVIYAITHIPSGRRYIGKSRNMRQRWYTHKSALLQNKHWCTELQRDWNAGGKTAFRLDVLRSELFSEEDTNCAEREEIFAAKDNIYNYMICTDPQGRLAILDKAREHQSLAIKAAWANPNSDLRNPRRIRWDDPDQRRVQSESQKRRYTDPAQRALTAIATKEGQTEAVRKRKSEAAKASWANPNSVQRTIKRVLKHKLWANRWSDPEAKKRQSEALKAAWAKRKQP